MKTPMSREILDNWSLPGPPKHPLTVRSRWGQREQLQRTAAAQRDSALPKLSPADHVRSASAPHLLRAHPSPAAPAALRCRCRCCWRGRRRRGAPWASSSTWPTTIACELAADGRLAAAGWLAVAVSSSFQTSARCCCAAAAAGCAACAGTLASLPASAAGWMLVAVTLQLLLPAGAGRSPPSHCISSHFCSYSDDVPDSIEYEHVQLIAKVRRQRPRRRGGSAQHATTAC